MEFIGVAVVIIIAVVYKLIRWDSVEIDGRKYYINIFGNKSL